MTRRVPIRLILIDDYFVSIKRLSRRFADGGQFVGAPRFNGNIEARGYNCGVHGDVLSLRQRWLLRKRRVVINGTLAALSTFVPTTTFDALSMVHNWKAQSHPSNRFWRK